MNQYKLIDPKLAAKTGMTAEEAQAVIDMWTVRHRLNDHLEGIPPVTEFVDGLTIPKDEVKQYLKQIRAHRPSSLRQPRPIATDVRLAMVALGAIVLIVASVSSAIGGRRNRGFELPPEPNVVRVTPDGMRVTTLSFKPSHWLTGRSINPDRYVFAVEDTVYEPAASHRPTSDIASLLATLTEVIGGPLSDHSQVPADAISATDITMALASSPQADEYGNRRYSARSYNTGSMQPGELIDWKEVRIAYGGKAVQAYLPFAKVSDKALREAVEKEQTRLIQALAESALSTAKH